MKKKIKKNVRKEKYYFYLWFNTTWFQFLSAIDLVAIAFSFCSLKNESNFFNNCVAEIIEDGGSNSEAVRYCNWGN